MKSLTLLILTLLLLFPDLSHSNNGTITGKVIDANSMEELIGVNILILGTELGGTTDIDGNFVINNIQPGIYNIEFRYLGFRSYIQSDVVVRNHRPTHLEIQLQPTAIQGQEIIVKSSYFVRDDSSPVSRTSFNAEEIRRSPGAGQELSRVIMASPGVATNGDTSQDLLVRGGSASENGFYIDHIPVPGISHFERQNSRTNGPIGIVNTDLVENLDFYAGGFSAAYGNHASSVAEIKYREGDRNRFHGNLDLSMAGFGTTLESPIAQGKGSLLVSARRSYLDVLADAINAGGAPRYGDIQIKAVYDINTKNKITAINIFGDSLFKNSREEAEEQGFTAYAKAHTYQNTTGMNWRSIWNSNFYSNTSFSWSVKQDDTQQYFVEDNSTDVDFIIRRTITSLRNTNYYILNDQNRFEFGFQADHRSGDFDYYIGPSTNLAGVDRPEFQRNLNLDEISGGTFFTWMTRPVNRLALTLGTRADYNSLNEQFSISPRTGLTYGLTDVLTLKASAGIYRQSVPLYFKSQNPSFESLKDYKTHQFVLGLDYQLNEETMISVEGYEKQYFNLPALPQNHTLGNEIFVLETEMFFDELEDNGRSYARGMDIILQKKLAQNFYGMISGSLFRTEFKNSEGDWVSRNFDVNYIFNVIGGYRPNNQWEFSARWSYIGERPITPIDEISSAMAGSTILNYAEYNQGRMPAYHSLFVRFDRRWFLQNLSLTTFMEVWNTYNRENVEGYYWNQTENRVDSFNQFSTLPVGGISIEF